MITDDQARSALFKINESAAMERRLTGTIVEIRGRNVSVLLDGEGTSVVTAYRGIFEPSINAGVTIERAVGTNHWRVVGIRDSALGATSSMSYDFERRGDVLYYPLALEAINNAAYNLGTGLEITVYNVQYQGLDGLWRYHAATVFDLLDDVPDDDSRWVIIYADIESGILRKYAHDETASPDNAWPAAINGLLNEKFNAIPLLAIRLNDGMTAWGDAWKVIKRGFSFDGKYIIRLPNGGSGSGGGVATAAYYTVTSDISGVGHQMTLQIPEINIELLFDRSGSDDPRLSLRTLVGTENYDHRTWQIDSTGTVIVDNGDNESIGLSNVLISDYVEMESNHTLEAFVRRVSSGDVWRVGIFSSGAGERTTIWATPAGLNGFLGTGGWNAVPPTQTHIDTELGADAATLGAGYQGIVDDESGEGNLIYHVISDGVKWWYTPMRPAT